jgi:anaerobic magnesium-protoporphyrin IX monomethyl ester cyclase
VKVALVSIGRRVELTAVEPFSLEIIAAYLEKFGIDVKIVDELAGQNVLKEIKRYQPDIVGITSFTTTVYGTYQLADICRAMKIKTVIGGVHATILPDEAIKHADVVVTGEGEIAMLDIIQKEIKSGIIKGTPMENLDDVPIYNRKGIEMDFYTRLPQTYLRFLPQGMRAAGMLQSRGCGNACTFCHNSWKGLKYRYNSAERVIEEMKYLMSEYHVGAIAFQDDNLFMNRIRLKKICETIIDENIPIIWCAQSRVDNANLEMFKLAKQAGCKQITFGIETGSQRMLDVMNKRTTVEQNIQAIELCHEVGIQVTSSFMIGNPTETVEDVRMTQRFIKEHPIDSAGVNITTPFLGTKMWEWGKEQGLISENPDWSKFTWTGINDGVTLCTTIPRKQLGELFIETQKLCADKNAHVSPKWFISMGIHHPIKSVTMAWRSRDKLPKYLKRMVA